MRAQLGNRGSLEAMRECLRVGRRRKVPGREDAGEVGA